MPGSHSILIVDDDPDHLKIYGWILSAAGFDPMPCLAKRTELDLPGNAKIDLIVLDYALHTMLTTPQVAAKITAAFPGAPIVLLSDLYGIPEDVAPYIAAFARKGDPAKLIDTLRQQLRITS